MRIVCIGYGERFKTAHFPVLQELTRQNIVSSCVILTRKKISDPVRLEGFSFDNVTTLESYISDGIGTIFFLCLPPMVAKEYRQKLLKKNQIVVVETPVADNCLSALSLKAHADKNLFLHESIFYDYDIFKAMTHQPNNIKRHAIKNERLLGYHLKAFINAYVRKHDLTSVEVEHEIIHTNKADRFLHGRCVTDLTKDVQNGMKWPKLPIDELTNSPELQKRLTNLVYGYESNVYHNNINFIPSYLTWYSILIAITDQKYNGLYDTRFAIADYIDWRVERRAIEWFPSKLNYALTFTLDILKALLR